MKKNVNETILVSESNIAALPEDDVPESIWATIEHTENIDHSAMERASYIPDAIIDTIGFDEPRVTDVIPMNYR